MVGPSPAEDARGDLARDRNDARLTWSQNVRTVLRIFETHREQLPYPTIFENAITFSFVSRLGRKARKALADAEAALGGELGVTFTAGPAENRYRFNLTAALPGGTALIIEAATEDVAELDDGGQWVRLPVEDEEG
jgi:hypothetical protein